MDKKTVLRNLLAQRKWVKDQLVSKGRTGGEASRAYNRMIGCLQTLRQCGQQGLTGWLDRSRRGRRKAVANIQLECTSRKGSRALLDLVDLTVSAVSAASWVDDLWIGALPIRFQPAKITEAQREAARRNIGRLHRKQREAKRQYETALQDRIAGERSNHTLVRAAG